MYDIIKFFVDHLGDSFCMVISCFVMIGPYMYELIMGLNARITYSKEDIQNTTKEVINETGKAKFAMYVIIWFIYKFLLIIGGIALGAYIGDQINKITLNYIHNGLYETIKHWPWQ